MHVAAGYAHSNISPFGEGDEAPAAPFAVSDADHVPVFGASTPTPWAVPYHVSVTDGSGPAVKQPQYES